MLSSVERKSVQMQLNRTLINIRKICYYLLFKLIFRKPEKDFLCFPMKSSLYKNRFCLASTFHQHNHADLPLMALCLFPEAPTSNYKWKFLPLTHLRSVCLNFCLFSEKFFLSAFCQHMYFSNKIISLI